MFSPARWTIASTPSSERRRSCPRRDPTEPRPGRSVRRGRRGAARARRPSSAAVRAVPISPDDPVIAIRTASLYKTGQPAIHACGGRERIVGWTSRRSSPASGPARSHGSRCSAAGSRTTTTRWTRPAARTCSASPGATPTRSASTAAVEHEAALAAAAVGVGPEVVTFVEPEGYLVTRFIEGSIVPLERDARAGVDQARGAGAEGDPSRAVAAGALQLVSGRRGLPDDGVLARRRGAAELRLGAPGGAARRAGAGRVRRASLSQRSPQRELHRRRPAPADRRLGVRGHGRRLLRSRELLDQPRARPRRPRGAARGVLRRGPSRRTSGRSS